MTTSDKKLLTELAITLVVKIALLFVLWHLFFFSFVVEEDANDITQPRIQLEQGEAR
jgi:hypothetical protein